MFGLSVSRLSVLNHYYLGKYLVRYIQCHLPAYAICIQKFFLSGFGRGDLSSDAGRPMAAWPRCANKQQNMLYISTRSTS